MADRDRLDRLDRWLGEARRRPLFAPDRALAAVDWGRDAVERLLPHRGPMLLVDRIEAVDQVGRLIQGARHLAPDDPGFDGHFPGAPVYPGVLQVEMSAQLGLCLAGLPETGGAAPPEPGGPPAVRLSRILGAVFVDALGPGDRLTVQSRVVEDTGLTVVCLGQIRCGDRIASASLVEAVLL